MKDDTGVYERLCWIGDARKNAAVMELVDYLGVLVEKYAGGRPVMK